MRKRPVKKDPEEELIAVEEIITESTTIPQRSRFHIKSYTPFLVVLLIIASFFLGMLYTKLTYIEEMMASGVGAAPVTLTDALKKYARQVKLNTSQFNSCFDSNKYAERVNNDLTQGTNVGVRGTPGFFINGRFLNGAFPFEIFKEVIDKELASTGSNDPLDYSEALQQYANPEAQSFNPVPKIVDLGDSPVKGDKNAKVAIVEFSDFQCPYCSRAVPTINQIMNEYKGQVKLVYKHLPLTSIHPNAQKAAEASECAREQNKFWEYHDLLFNNQKAWETLPNTPQV